MRKICPFMLPCPLAITAPKRLRKSFTITLESRPRGAFTAVTDEPGECGANSSRPSFWTAAREAGPGAVQAQLLDRGACGPRQQLRILDQIVHADLLHVFQ